MGHGRSAYGRLRDAGARPGLGTDVVVNSPADLFEPMRDTLRTERQRTGIMVPADVHTVIVDGRLVKRDGRLVDLDLAALRHAGRELSHRMR